MTRSNVAKQESSGLIRGILLAAAFAAMVIHGIDNSPVAQKFNATNSVAK